MRGWQRGKLKMDSTEELGQIADASIAARD